VGAGHESGAEKADARRDTDVHGRPQAPAGGSRGAHLFALQRLAGNRATAGLLKPATVQRETDPAKQAEIQGQTAAVEQQARQAAADRPADQAAAPPEVPPEQRAATRQRMQGTIRRPEEVATAATQTTAQAAAAREVAAAPAEPVVAARQDAAPATGGDEIAAAHAAATGRAAQANAVSQAAVAEAAALAMPEAPAPVAAPELAQPVDAAGQPVPGDPAGDVAVAALAMRLQNLRADAARLAARGTAAHGQSLALRSGIAAAQAKVGEAAAATDGLAAHATQRRAVATQAKSAADVSEQKAATVAAQAPGIGEQAAAGGQQTGPMAQESQQLAGSSAGAHSDDAEAGEKTRQQSGQLTQVGGQLGRIDQAIGQTGARAGQLAQDAAAAQARNATARGQVAEADAAIERTEQKVTQMRGQTQAAQAKLDGLQAGPAQMATSAGALREQSERVSGESVALEQRLHAAQAAFLADTAATPAAVPRRRGPSLQRDAYAGRERVELAGDLPPWFTGEEPASARERMDHQARAAAQRRAELAAIDAEAHGHFETLGTGAKVGLALELTFNRLRGDLGSTDWPKFGLTLLRGLVDPRVALTGVVSGFGMILSGGANLLSAAQWQRDPLGNLLKSAADIATGVTVVLGSIAGLAVAIIAICAALILVTLGFASPVCLPVISICTTVAATVGPWAVTAAEVALVLNGLVLIKNLIDAATAPTAERLQGSVENMTEDAKAMGNMAAIIVMDRAGRAVGPRVAGAAGRLQAGLEASGSATARQLGQSMGDIGAAMAEGQARADRWTGRQPTPVGGETGETAGRETPPSQSETPAATTETPTETPPETSTPATDTPSTAEPPSTTETPSTTEAPSTETPGTAEAGETPTGREQSTTGKLRTGARTGSAPTAESITEGSVRMEDHPRFQAEIQALEARGFKVVRTSGDPHVVVRRVVLQDGTYVRTDLEIHIRDGMRFLDLEHEIGHVNQMMDTARFPDGPPPTKIVVERPDGTFYDAPNQAGVLTSWQDPIVEYHNRLQEVIALSERGASPEVMREHLRGLEQWRELYMKKGLRGGRSPSQVAWRDEHFPDIRELEQRAADIRNQTPPAGGTGTTTGGGTSTGP
jgi:hypothetical protein